MTDIEKLRAQRREATKRWRAKKKMGGTVKQPISAPSGVKLREIPGFSNYRADANGNAGIFEGVLFGGG